ncbi:alpha/beta hydrolase [Nocardioides daeguensis]|uniref:Alpha/beta hydrolase n=1 Tax=Nocardioides daeguensis TaxID=908359 RepID=A0ABP6VZA1_9ACTN|nr:alpha/beta hydrolase [Nocardioides daeguensis]MBV6726656.1 alpha/beta hydrolase [Nocardioides daeguensis]MCR1774592.1 alpha/beta hydrolase [Nocardioides daeguensis]
MPVDPSLAGLLEAIAAGTPLSELSPADARAVFRAMTVDTRPPQSLAPVASIEDDKVAGADGPLAARVYRPDGAGPFPTVVLLHGGGWVIGDLDTHAPMARAICAGTDSVVVAVDYRLAPEARFPAAAQDAIAAVRDVQSRLVEYGGSDVLAVAGDSAGGNLSAVAAQHVPGLAAQLLVYPATDVLGDFPSRAENAHGYFLDEPTMAWFIGCYADADTDLTDPRLSPLRGELAGLPPAVVVTAEFDPLRDEGVAYADALAAAGVPVRQTTYPGLIHGFFDMGPWSARCQDAVDDTIAQFAELLRR